MQAPRSAGSSERPSIIRQAKGLALELKNQLKQKDPWDRQVEFQREATRKAYLKIIFSTAALTTSPSRSNAGSTARPPPSTFSQALEALNLLWLDTSHALIQLYRHRLAALDKVIAESPRPPKASRSKDRRGGNDGQVQLPPPPGPVARRKLAGSFQHFLSAEEEYWRTIASRMASRLNDEEQAELRPLGIVASAYDDEGRASQETPTVEQKVSMRRDVLPLVHKALICYGDLARYSESYSDTSAPKPLEPGGGGKGGKRGGKKGADAAKGGAPVKTFAKAAECYRQAALLIPDNGNPHNQLAVLAQYASDPLSSAYHYYRALALRIPFETAKTNLQTTYKKSLSRWLATEAEGLGQDGSSDAARFRSAFVALHAIFFTKQRLADLHSLSGRVDALFVPCVRDRLITSDVVLKVVVTSLSALWYARMTRSSVLNESSTALLSRSKSTSTSAVPPSASAARPSSPKLEAHVLLHVLRLYTNLLTVSSAETNELWASNVSVLPTSPDDPDPRSEQPVDLNANISAVLRRSIPALRILGKWLRGQMEYIERVQGRVEASEQRRLRRRGSGDQGESIDEEEAQRSLESTTTEEDGTPVVSTAEFARTLEEFWSAFADYSNSIKLAFPAERGLPVLEDAVWLEEDVELLGFAPLRKAKSASQGIGEKEGARKVGRDVHPNQEVLMRVEEGQRLAQKVAESRVASLDIVDGAFVFVPKDLRLSQQEQNEQRDAPEEDADVPDHGTEDDPVDRAMRIVGAASNLDMNDVKEIAEPDPIAFSRDPKPSLALVAAQTSGSPGFPRQGNLGRSKTNPMSTLTAADLRQQLFPSQLPPAVPDLANGFPSGAPVPQNPSYTSPPLISPFNNGPAQVGASIWGAPPPPLMAHHAPSSGPSLLPQHQPVTAHSFESIPNLVHNSPAAHALGWSGSTNLPPPPHSSALPPSVSATALFGGHPAFAPTSPPMHPPNPSAAPPGSSRTYSFNALQHPPSTFHDPHPTASPHFPPPGLSTAHVGLAPAPIRTNSSSNLPGGGVHPGTSGALPPPRESGGGWPAHLGGSASASYRGFG
ncbi:hypothetical protein JCM10212_003526 [Sporobolomyces blumeae]